MINPNYTNLEVPKMILQPIIENAFVHAIEPFGKDATIKLFTRVDTEKNILYLCIKDFGPGIPEDKIESIKNYLQDATFERTTKGSIGIKNIQQRLEMFYGEDYKIRTHESGLLNLRKIDVFRYQKRRKTCDSF